jgi:hypothetical protein
LVGDIPADRATYFGTTTVAGNVITTGSQTYTANLITLGSGLSGQTQNFETSGGDVRFNIGAPGSGGNLTPATSNAVVQLRLNGGSMSGLEGTSVSYQNISNYTYDAGQMHARYQAKNVFEKELYGAEFGDVEIGTVQEVDCKVNSQTPDCK